MLEFGATPQGYVEMLDPHWKPPFRP